MLDWYWYILIVLVGGSLIIAGQHTGNVKLVALGVAINVFTVMSVAFAGVLP